MSKNCWKVIFHCGITCCSALFVYLFIYFLQHYTLSSMLVKSLYSVPGVGAECLIANSSHKHLDADLPENIKYMHKTVTYDFLISDCRRRNGFSKAQQKLLRSFMVPDYVRPRSATGFFILFVFNMTRRSFVKCFRGK